MTTTVKMPEPITRDDTEHGKLYCTVAQLQAYGDARMLEERERCAKVCDNRAYTHTNTAMLGPEQNALKCAAAIRKGAEE